MQQMFYSIFEKKYGRKDRSIVQEELNFSLCILLHLIIENGIIFFCIFSDAVTLLSVTKDELRVCGETFVIRCQSNDTACCDVIGKTRVWKKNGVVVMNHGTSIDSKKYTETFDNDLDFFDLTIHDLNDGDFGKDYSCSYSANDDSSMMAHLYDLCKCL